MGIWGGADRFATHSDEDLMALVAEGNRAAFSALSRRHIRRSLALAQRITGNPMDAEDVVQEAFVQVWLHAGRWRNDGARFTTWLYRIVVNRALDCRRSTSLTAGNGVPLEEGLPVADPAPGAEALVAGMQMEQVIAATIAGLPERQRAAISLCSDQALRCAQAAEVLGISVSAMESLLVRARRTLRQRLRSTGFLACFLKDSPASTDLSKEALPSKEALKACAGNTGSEKTAPEDTGRQGPKEADTP